MVSGSVFKVLFLLGCDSKETLSTGTVGEEKCYSRDCNLLTIPQSHPLEKEIFKKRLEVQGAFSAKSHFLAALEENRNKDVKKGMSGS